MGYYGRDYTSGRFTNRNYGQNSGSYDSDFTGGYGGGWSAGRGQGWGNDRGYGWSNRGRTGGFGNFDQGWRSGGNYDRGQTGYGEQGWNATSGFRGNSFDNSGFRGNSFDNSGFRGNTFDNSGLNRGRMGSYGGMDRGYYGNESYGHDRFGHDYDQDFGDRLRRGWNRVRQEARGWIGRGYDRNW